MRVFLVRCYAALAYAAFVLPIGYLVGFLADAGVPVSVDRGAGPLGPSLLVDVALLVAFGLQHSVMARPGFKRGLERILPSGLERSTYVLVSGLTLSAVFWLWRPIPLVLWDVGGTALEPVAWAGFALGWGVAVWSTFALSHLHLFGVVQAEAHARGKPTPSVALRETLLYRLVRHPMTAGLLLAFWCAPRMTLGHAVFAAGMTLYSLAATVLEERDLLRAHPRYRAYRASVPALVPFLRPGRGLPRRGGMALELGLVLAAALAPFLLVGPSLQVDPPPSGLPSLARDTLMVDGTARTFAHFDPDGGRAPAAGGASASGPVREHPVVLALHGTGGSADRLQLFLGGELERLAARRGWLVVYPEAWGGAWNDCRLQAGEPARTRGVDDVAFLDALVAHLRRDTGADPGRVFLLGYSGGGHMAFRAAREAPELVRAAAVFGASPPAPGASLCPVPHRGVPLLLVNGTEDPVNPFRGGDVITPDGRPLGPVLGAGEGARRLARVGGGAEVRLVAVQGGGHLVPGPASRFPSAVGRNVPSVAGVAEALDFFSRHIGAQGAVASAGTRSGPPLP